MEALPLLLLAPTTLAIRFEEEKRLLSDARFPFPFPVFAWAAIVVVVVVGPWP